VADAKGREFGSKLLALEELIALNQEIHKRIG
jgi:hypothetical protein